jgi:lipopolysaccharide assembly protein A
MRWIYLVIVILFVAAILILVFQNLGVVTMSFLGFSVRAPLAIFAVVVYVLGALTGGSLYALLRHSLRESKARSETRP